MPQPIKVSRRYTTEHWASLNPILLLAEIGIETDTKKFKIGDGRSHWNDLEYNDSGSGGGIGGNIADQQVAFGDGTDIAGDPNFKWDSENTVLSLGVDYIVLSPFGDSVFGGGGLKIDDSGRILVADQMAVSGGGAGVVNFGDPDNTVGIALDVVNGNFQLINLTGNSIDIGAALYFSVNCPLVLPPQPIPDSPAEGWIWENGTDHALYWFDGTNTKEIVDMIDDVLQLTPRADPDSPVEGMIWAGTDHHLYYYNGTTKKQLDNAL